MNNAEHAKSGHLLMPGIYDSPNVLALFKKLNKHYKAKSKLDYETFKRLVIVLYYNSNNTPNRLEHDFKAFFKSCFPKSSTFDLVYEAQHPEGGYISVHGIEFKFIDPLRENRRTFENKVIEKFVMK